MSIQLADMTDLEKIRQQFNYGPYPRVPLEVSPKEDDEELFIHNLITPYYLRFRRVIDPRHTVILDAGCGSGYKALMLAAANPGARVVGIDISEESVRMAQQRIEYHQIPNAEFHVLSVYDLPQLGLEFDYINCDEVLYLLPDAAAGLQAMRSVLKPNGLIRTNLHNAYQRASFFRAQALFKYVGLMNDAPQEFEEETVVETMEALKEGVRLRRETWGREINSSTPTERKKEILGANYLLMGDKGFTVPDLFRLLEAADLEFISMVNWRRWEITDLFRDPDDLPTFWSVGLMGASIEERLHLYELMHPVHRLLDFWCTPSSEEGRSVDDWSDQDWRSAIVHLHPQLRTSKLKQSLIESIRDSKAFEMSASVKLPTLTPVYLEPTIASCLLPLWDQAQPIQALMARYQAVRPVDPVTLTPISDQEAFEAVKDLLNRLDAFLYVLLELSE